jgi:hypothetical protein
VPQASRYIDGVIYLSEASRGWGVIQTQVSGRIVIIEHFSRPPSLAKMVSGRAKLSWMTDLWWRQPDRRHGRRPPLLLVISSGRPRKALAQLPEIAAGSLRGVWETTPSAFGDTLIVDVKGLEETDGTSLLRLMHAAKPTVEARERIGHLLTDPVVDDTLRAKLIEGIMQGTVELTAEEQELTYRSVLERGRAEGREEGREEGRGEALLRIAAKIGGDEVADELASIEDPDELEKRVLELLR